MQRMPLRAIFQPMPSSVSCQNRSRSNNWRRQLRKYWRSRIDAPLAQNMKGDVAILGGGPSGLMAAERLSALGHRVTVYEQMPTIGRKFLLAGKSGLNITHSEDFAAFSKRFGASSDHVLPALTAFNPAELREWADELGAETFVGSSGRVFPKAMKASPLLRAWVKRLE